MNINARQVIKKIALKTKTECVITLTNWNVPALRQKKETFKIARSFEPLLRIRYQTKNHKMKL